MIFVVLFLLYTVIVVQCAPNSACHVHSKALNHTFDIHSLRKSSADYVVKTKLYSFYLNFCGPLHDTTVCGSSNSTQICQTWDNDASSVILGDANNVELKAFDNFIDEGLEIHVKGGTVRYGVEADSIIEIVCSGNSEAAPTFVREDVATFTYWFTWPRREACVVPPPPSNTTVTVTTTTATTSGTSSGGGTTSSGHTPTTSSAPSGNSTTSTPGTSGNHTTSVSPPANGTTTVTAPHHTTGSPSSGSHSQAPHANAPSSFPGTLMAVLIVLGGLFLFGLLAIVAVYFVRRKRRLSGYESLLSKPEQFARI